MTTILWDIFLLSIGAIFGVFTLAVLTINRMDSDGYDIDEECCGRDCPRRKDEL